MVRTAQQYKDLSIKEFTKAAARYEADHAGIYEVCKDDYPPILAELEKQPFTDLLDAGCGTAPMISLLAEKWPDRHYVGLDLTPAMIDVAQAKNIPCAEFVVGDCENLPFQLESFDVVICSQSFHHYPNPQDFFNSVNKVLRPGGKLVLRDWTVSGFKQKFVNGVYLKLANITGHGDVGAYSTREISEMVDRAGLMVEVMQVSGLHLHCVVRKPA
ncbi:MAG: class I SAM-dependent methyltransferase [Coriobacteriia bacterium]|nr:class I SAM-dependent methyltransferase [Coriobacteriia bacterium]